jgi:hypothetical protein
MGNVFVLERLQLLVEATFKIVCRVRVFGVCFEYDMRSERMFVSGEVVKLDGMDKVVSADGRGKSVHSSTLNLLLLPLLVIVTIAMSGWTQVSSISLLMRNLRRAFRSSFIPRD